MKFWKFKDHNRIPCAKISHNINFRVFIQISRGIIDIFPILGYFGAILGKKRGIWGSGRQLCEYFRWTMLFYEIPDHYLLIIWNVMALSRHFLLAIPENNLLGHFGVFSAPARGLPIWGTSRSQNEKKKFIVKPNKFSFNCKNK